MTDCYLRLGWFSPLPQNRRAGKLHSAQCGQVWQGQYARLHAAILDDEPFRQRLAVVKAHKNGLGDRLTAAVTIFYYALLSGELGWSNLGLAPYVQTQSTPALHYTAPALLLESSDPIKQDLTSLYAFKQYEAIYSCCVRLWASRKRLYNCVLWTCDMERLLSWRNN